MTTGFNAARPYRAVSGARSVTELSAFVYHHTKILANASALPSQTPGDFPAAVKGIVTTLKAASHFAQVTRFNWKALVRGDMDATILDYSMKCPEKKSAPPKRIQKLVAA